MRALVLVQGLLRRRPVFGASAFGSTQFGGIPATPYHRELLALARQLQAEKRPEMAAIAAATACEIVTDMSIQSHLNRAGVGQLRKPLGKFVQSFNLKNDRVYGVYFALSNDNVNQQKFWNTYTELVDARNKAVHEGRTIDLGKIAELLDAADDFVAHLERGL